MALIGSWNPLGAITKILSENPFLQPTPQDREDMHDLAVCDIPIQVTISLENQ